MKIRANITLDIDLTPEDIIAAMQDKDFEEFQKKMEKVAAEYHAEKMVTINCKNCGDLMTVHAPQDYCPNCENRPVVQFLRRLMRKFKYKEFLN